MISEKRLNAYLRRQMRTRPIIPESKEQERIRIETLKEVLSSLRCYDFHNPGELTMYQEARRKERLIRRAKRLARLEREYEETIRKSTQ